MRRTPIIHTLRSDGTYTTAAALASDTGATPTFARNCVAYRDYWDGTTRKLASVAANVPRWCERKDTDGNLVKGILLESEVTNMCPNSTFATGWSYTRCDPGNGSAAPDSAYTMRKLVEKNLTGAIYTIETNSNFSVVNGGTYTCSFFARKLSRDYCLGDLYWFVNPGQNVPYVFYNLATGTIGTYNNCTGAGMENYGGGIYRCWFTFTANRNSQVVGRIWLAAQDNSFSYTGVAGTDAIEVWGFQMATGSIYPGSYIATTTAPATRLKDDYSLNVTGRIGQRGSLVFDIMFPAQDLVAAVVPVSLHDGSADNRITCSILAAGDVASATVVSGGDTQADITDATINVCDGDKHTIAISWEPNSVKLYVDGTLEGTADTEATIPSGITTLTLGDHAGANQPNALISDLKLYNRPGVTS